MSDSVLNTFAQQLGRHHHDHHGDDPDASENCGAFGWLRDPKERALYLEFRLKDGNITALGYSWLERCEYDASDGITLRFTGQAVRFVGRNLNREMRPHVKLFEGIVRHRIPWIQEADEPMAMTAAKHATVIERVEFI